MTLFRLAFDICSTLDSDWPWRGAVQRVGLRETPAAYTSYFKECDFCQRIKVCEFL